MASGPGGGGFGGRFGRARFNFDQTSSDFQQDYSFCDSNFKINFQPSDNSQVSLSGYLGGDGLTLGLPSFRQEVQRNQAMNWGNQVGRALWTQWMSDRLKWSVQLSASRYDSNFGVADSESQDAGAGRGLRLSHDNELNDLTGKFDLTFYSSPSYETRVGA